MKRGPAGVGALALLAAALGGCTGSASDRSGVAPEPAADYPAASLPDAPSRPVGSAALRSTPMPGQGSAQVAAIQRALGARGHRPGPVDGLMGPRTRAALRAFQRAEGIEPTGRPDPATIAALGLAR